MTPSRFQPREDGAPEAVAESGTASAVTLVGVAMAVAMAGAATLLAEMAAVREADLLVGRGPGGPVVILVGFLVAAAFGASRASRDPERSRRLLPLAALAGALVLGAWGAMSHGLTLRLGAGWRAGGQVPSLVARMIHAFIPSLAAALLGACLPLSLSALTRDRRLSAGPLWASAGLGSAAGALVAAFVALPQLGLASTRQLAAGLAATSGLLAWSVLPRTEPSDEHLSARTADPHAHDASEDGTALGATRLVFLAGMAAMVTQLAWTRFLTLVVGTAAQAQALALSSSLIAGAAGAWMASGRGTSPGGQRPARLLIGAGIALAVGLVLGARLPVALAWALDRAPHLAVLTLAAAALLVAGPAAFVLGAVVPATLQALPGVRAGRIQAASLAGWTAGALLWTWGITGRIGMQGTLFLTGVALVTLGAWHLEAGLRSVSMAAACCVAVFALIPAWSPALLSSGPYMYSRQYAARARAAGADLTSTMAAAGVILYHQEGPSATVAVRQEASGTRSMVIDGKTDAATLRDMRTQRLLGHLPALVRLCDSTPVSLGSETPQADGAALVIGLGAGVTAGAVLSHPFGRVDIVELLPEVARASAFFSADSRAPLLDARTRLVLEDARIHVARQHARYDLITSEPTNPWVAGSASLFSTEFFQTCRQALAPHGVMCQWVPAYQQTPEQVRSIVAAFREAFPRATLWETSPGQDYLLIGATAPGMIQLETWRQAFHRTGLAGDLGEVEVRDPEDLMGRFVAGPRELAQLCAGVVPVSDDRPGLDGGAVPSLGTGSEADEVQAWMEGFRGDPATIVADAGQGFAEAIARRRLKEDAMVRLRQGDVTSARRLLARARRGFLGADGVLPPRTTESLAFLRGFDLMEARERLQEGDVAGAERHLSRLISRNPRDADLINELGQLYIASGRVGEARTTYETLGRSHPDYPYAWRNLGLLALGTGDLDTALRSLRRAMYLVPHEPEVHTLLARTYLAQGRLDDASEQFRNALVLDPASALAKAGLVKLAKAGVSRGDAL